MKGRRTCVKATGESLPPRVEEGTNGVGRPAADGCPDSLDRRPIAGAQEGVGRLTHVGLRDAPDGVAIAGRELAHLRSVTNNTEDICYANAYIISLDNDSYRVYDATRVTMKVWN